MNRLLFLILFLPVVNFSQDSIFVDVPPAKIKMYVSVFIPLGNKFVCETYHNWRHNFWFSHFDTLTRTAGDSLKGKTIAFKPGHRMYKVETCDPQVNKVRNDALEHYLHSKLTWDTCRALIGYNQAYVHMVDSTLPRKKISLSTCHTEFKAYCINWYNEQLLKLMELKRKKEERLSWIKTNPEKMDKLFMWKFFKDYGRNKMDQEAIIEIIKAKPDIFIEVCKDKEFDFYELNSNLFPLPEGVSAKDAIGKLATSAIESDRKDVLIERLQKRKWK